MHEEPSPSMAPVASCRRWALRLHYIRLAAVQGWLAPPHGTLSLDDRSGMHIR